MAVEWKRQAAAGGHHRGVLRESGTADTDDQYTIIRTITKTLYPTSTLSRCGERVRPVVQVDDENGHVSSTVEKTVFFFSPIF